ncbi:hypothetical protein CONPUDRAFT_70762 [Coniophora puteana RWD-64-598 SS2]|uniref:Uncharacterized protein n=1 Tax=Coniophora puteana (strain RWD-64-598) TaxID=741705 RepID=A0A5M3MXL0_CONPW|nr:uncharacterized protein CONPUDRAFT_70762 [Coniophora puteana RWD-64-598 SS2]EIW83826.1 hypothetical protein CONPUDRAFT_70762 [Coniophora puteana RWD-64-598 SS2]
MAMADRIWRQQVWGTFYVVHLYFSICASRPLLAAHDATGNYSDSSLATSEVIGGCYLGGVSNGYIIGVYVSEAVFETYALLLVLCNAAAIPRRSDQDLRSMLIDHGAPLIVIVFVLTPVLRMLNIILFAAAKNVAFAFGVMFVAPIIAMLNARIFLKICHYCERTEHTWVVNEIDSECETLRFKGNRLRLFRRESLAYVDPVSESHGPTSWCLSGSKAAETVITVYDSCFMLRRELQYIWGKIPWPLQAAYAVRKYKTIFQYLCIPIPCLGTRCNSLIWTAAIVYFLCDTTGNCLTVFRVVMLWNRDKKVFKLLILGSACACLIGLASLLVSAKLMVYDDYINWNSGGGGLSESCHLKEGSNLSIIGVYAPEAAFEIYALILVLCNAAAIPRRYDQAILTMLMDHGAPFMIIVFEFASTANAQNSLGK